MVRYNYALSIKRFYENQICLQTSHQLESLIVIYLPWEDNEDLPGELDAASNTAADPACLLLVPVAMASDPDP